MAKKLGWKDFGGEFGFVQVTTDRKLKVYGCWQKFIWKMQGREFVCDVRAIELHTYDLVLGLSWLKSIKYAFQDYKNTVMQFWYKGNFVSFKKPSKNHCKLCSQRIWSYEG